jgi:alkylresorcinol/alkylpyrone synthase
LSASSPPRLAAIATATPPHRFSQAEVREEARRAFSERADLFKRLESVFDNAGVETRYFSRPLDWFHEPRGWTISNAAYLEVAESLLEQAAALALRRAGIAALQIDTIVTVSSTGVATPSLEARLLSRLGFREDVQRLPVFGLGCGGGVLGLARAAQMAAGGNRGGGKGVGGGETVLLLVVELCSLTFRLDDLAKSNLVATALFGDGAAAAVLTPSGTGPAITGWGEHTWPDSLDVMGWRVEDLGLGVIFQRSIPDIVRNQFRSAADAMLACHDLAIADIEHFVCHPGGAKVIDALEAALSRPPGSLTETRAALRDYGNMSAASVLFALEGALRAKPKGRMLLSALGPGFSAGFCLMEC